jgi:tetratricopeptide (TPR) repeat protein
LGVVYLLMGRPQEAIDCLLPASLILRQTGELEKEGHTLFNMALCFEGMGQRAKAVNRAQAALEVLEKVHHPQAAIVRQQLQEWSS